MRRTLARLLLVALSTALAILAAEFALRHVFHALPQLELDLYQKDADGNLRLRPNIERRHVTRLWDVHIKTNSEGWRDPESAPNGNPVLALGDSMAFGWGVEQGETYLAQLEQSLGIPIVKAAVPGTGPTDQRDLLRTLWPQYRPRAVILSFFVGNDFVDVQMGGAKQFEVVDGLLVRKSIGGETSWPASTKARLIRTSRVLQLARAVQLNWTRPVVPQSEPRTWDEWLKEFAQIHRREYPDRTQKAVDDTLRTLDEIKQICDAHQAALILIIVPRSIQLDVNEQKEMQQALNLPEQDFDMDRPQQLLTDWAARRGVKSIDLLPAFRNWMQEHPAGRLYHTPDAHMNPGGHRLAAAAIESELRSFLISR